MNPQQTKPTILVAEDMESNYILLSYLLRADYNLLWAHDGEATLALYKANHVDLILMDVKMPKLDGIATTTQIRKTDTKTPIIALTAFAFESDHQRCLNAGCNDFLSKPLNSTILLAKIKQYTQQ